MVLSSAELKDACTLMSKVAAREATAKDVNDLFDLLASCSKDQLKEVITRVPDGEVKNKTEKLPIVLQSTVKYVMENLHAGIAEQIDFTPAKSSLRLCISPLKMLKSETLEGIAKGMGIRGGTIKTRLKKIMIEMWSREEEGGELAGTVLGGESYRCKVSLEYLGKVLTTCPMGWIPEMIRTVIGWMKQDVYMYGDTERHRALLEYRSNALCELCKKPRKSKSDPNPKSRVGMLMEMNKFYREIGCEDDDDVKRNRESAVLKAVDSIRNMIQYRIDHHLASLAPVSKDSEKYWTKEMADGKMIDSETVSLIRRPEESAQSFCQNEAGVLRKVSSDEASNPTSGLFLRPPQLESLRLLRESMKGDPTTTADVGVARKIDFSQDGEETELEEEDDLKEAFSRLSITARYERKLHLEFINAFATFISNAYLKERSALKGELKCVKESWDKMVEMDWARGENAHLLVLPTGCGKTGVAALLPYMIGLPRNARILAIVPSTIICDGLEENIPKFLIDKEYLPEGRTPRVHVLFRGKEDTAALRNSDICLATYQSLGLKNLLKLQRNLFDLIIVDEAHHEVAKSYRTIFQYFITARKVFLTATPQRGDTVIVDAKLVFSYPVAETIRHKYIKDMKLIEVGRNSLRGEGIRGDTRLEFDDIPHYCRFKWFVDCIGESESCQDTVLFYSLEKLSDLRETSEKEHKMIVFVSGVDKIYEVAERMETMIRDAGLFFSVGVIEGGATRTERDALRTNDIIINCKVLGEGYDNPEVSVITLLSRDMSIPPFLQKIGRGVRWVKNWEEEDQVCHVIAHAGLNVIDMWEAYRNETPIEDSPKLETSDPLFARVEDIPSARGSESGGFREKTTPFLTKK
jgi:superfamily II DNA or RNA helicase